MKRLICTLVLTIGILYGFGQEQQDTSYWQKGGTGSLTFTQTSLTNWSGGGDDAVSGNALVNLFVNYSRNRTSWENTLNLEYGLVKQGGQSVRKSIDKIDFASKLGVKSRGFWYYSALLGFKTQFAKGYNYPNKVDIVSDFLSPAYVILAFGMDYKPSEVFSAFFSPIAGKATIVNDTKLSNAGAFGVDPGDKFRGEFGALAKVAFKKDVMKNVNLQSILDLFTGYTDNFGNIDVNWEVLVAMKVNEFLTANISTTLKYDDDVDYINDKGVNKGPKIQFKEIIGIGLFYKF